MAHRGYLKSALVVDVEGTCWNYRPPSGEKSEIIEIGICPVDFSTMFVGEREGILVRPRFSTISPFCQGLTGISQEMVDKQGIQFTEAISVLLEKYNSQYAVMASWGDYDRTMFHDTCSLYGVKYPFGKTHLNIKYLFGIARGDSKEHGLGDAVSALGMEFDGQKHRGGDDAYNAAKILIHIIRSMRR